MGKDEKDELVEINIFSDLTNDDKLVFNVEIVEKKVIIRPLVCEMHRPVQAVSLQILNHLKIGVMHKHPEDGGILVK